ncbi:MAG: carboxyl-terminal protease, partial [Sphaerospermopsis kisseleviana]
MGFMNKQVFRCGFSLLLAFGLAFGLTFGSIPPANALTQQQKLVSEVWRIVNRSYLDETFNHQNWTEVRQKAFKSPLGNDQEAYKVIQNMLKSLDDP